MCQARDRSALGRTLSSYGNRRLHSPAALTLIELLIAMSIMVIIAGTLGAMARAVQIGAGYSEGHGTATQHARVTLDRIARTVSGATANENYPGAFIVLAPVSGQRLPETLVVWQAPGAIDSARRPLLSELIIFCPHSTQPGRLLQVTAPLNDALVSLDDDAGVRTQIDTIKKSSARTEIVLTDLVRTVSFMGSPRGAVRFEVTVTPSAQEWASYKSGALPWVDEPGKQGLPWVQGIAGSRTGLRQVRVRTELQLMPGKTALVDDPTGQQAIPFLGSAALYYDMARIEGK